VQVRDKAQPFVWGGGPFSPPLKRNAFSPNILCSKREERRPRGRDARIKKPSARRRMKEPLLSGSGKKDKRPAITRLKRQGRALNTGKEAYLNLSAEGPLSLHASSKGGGGIGGNLVWEEKGSEEQGKRELYDYLPKKDRFFFVM